MFNCKRKLQASFLGTLIFSLAANAFAYLNFYPQHDALNHSFRFADAWEVSLGRFLLPVYGSIRGDITIPWVIGILSIIFIASSVFLVVEILSINNLSTVFFTAGIFSANVCITEMCGIFIYVLDAYTLSLFMACLGVFFLSKYTSWYSMLLAIFCFIVSLGLYQAYITVVIALLIALVCKDALREQKIHGKMLHKWLKYFMAMLLSMIGYMICYKMALFFWNIESASSYNSLNALSSLQIQDIISSAIKLYSNLFSLFFENGLEVGVLSSICNIILCIVVFVLLAGYIRKNKISVYNKLILLCGIFIFPGCAVIMSILMNRSNIHFLTSYAMLLLYPVLYSVITNRKILNCCRVSSKKIKCFIGVTAGIIIFQNILYSNGAYICQKLLYDRALVHASQIIYEMEREPDYIANETPVIVIGTFAYNSKVSQIDSQQATSKYKALNAFYNTSITYAQTFGSFVRLLGGQINLELDKSITEDYAQLQEVQNMPVYPDEGYMQMVDDKMIIKVSEN